MIRSAVVLFMALLLPVEALSQDQAAGIAGVVAPGTTVELVKEGFQFTEGPVGTPDGGLYFTDIPASIMYRRLSGQYCRGERPCVRPGR